MRYRKFGIPAAIVVLALGAGVAAGQVTDDQDHFGFDPAWKDAEVVQYPCSQVPASQRGPGYTAQPQDKCFELRNAPEFGDGPAPLEVQVLICERVEQAAPQAAPPFGCNADGTVNPIQVEDQAVDPAELEATQLDRAAQRIRERSKR
jgi:hypothetical protein